MAAGVRITHPSETNATFTLVDGQRPYHEGVTCARCLRTHEFKTYHIELDDVGSAIVSREIWERLQAISGQPFRLDGEVAKPPARVLNLAQPAPSLTPVVAHKE